MLKCQNCKKSTPMNVLDMYNHLRYIHEYTTQEAFSEIKSLQKEQEHQTLSETNVSRQKKGIEPHQSSYLDEIRTTIE